MTAPDLSALRNEYSLKTLDESQVDRDPLKQFGVWMVEAIHAGVPEPTAMGVSTVGADGRPAGRICLLKGVDAKGFVFYTNYDSRKGRDLAAHPVAALTFMWKELERQVRIEGEVEKVSAAESDEYFNTRPLGSRIGAWASPQSTPIEGREWLEHRWSALAVEHGTTPARPENWGGYRVKADYLEFWQGRQSRLHDRIAYTRLGNAWEITRLAP